jgi:hypothetical protein
MIELSEWVLEQDNDYIDILMPDDISEFLQGEIPKETDLEPEQT